MVPLSIGGSSYRTFAGNSKGLAVADIATERDIDELTFPRCHCDGRWCQYCRKSLLANDKAV